MAEDPDKEGLELEPTALLYAFELMGPYATGKSNTAKLENRKELALALIDWAVMESDRGLRLLELTNEVEELRKKNGGGTIYIAGPFGLG